MKKLLPIAILILSVTSCQATPEPTATPVPATPTPPPTATPEPPH